MKQANHNAVDLLLRSLARGREGPVGEGASVTESAAVSDHLDVDELNLYAEGVLPALARSRYTEHLADCQRCRQLVIGLAQAAGRTVQTTTHSAGTSFWQSFTTMFSLPVLRYAFPAVLLTGVIVIGFVALREQRRPDLIAKNQQAEPAVAVDQLGDKAINAPASAAPSPALPEQSAQANTSARDPKNNPVDSSGLLAQRPAATSGGFPTDGSSAKSSPESPQVASVTTAQPTYAPEPAAPPPAPKFSSEVASKSIARKEEYDAREAAKRTQDELKLMSKDDSPRHGPARSRTMSTGRRRDADVTSEDRARGNKDKNEVAEEVETQTVSGRLFRREGKAWIDSAYQASRGATSVSRGSEQFRALLADEPGLRAIVQRLSGEVVVVWKGRAYRFR